MGRGWYQADAGGTSFIPDGTGAREGATAACNRLNEYRNVGKKNLEKSLQRHGMLPAQRRQSIMHGLDTGPGNVVASVGSSIAIVTAI
jgi:hypothetical protein